MNNSSQNWFLPTPGNHPFRTHWVGPAPFGQLLLIETAERQHERITELLTQWVLQDSFYLIAGNNCIPDYDDLQYSVSQYTHAFNEALDHMSLTRARTCFQLLDLLKEAD